MNIITCTARLGHEWDRVFGTGVRRAGFPHHHCDAWSSNHNLIDALGDTSMANGSDLLVGQQPRLFLTAAPIRRTAAGIQRLSTTTSATRYPVHPPHCQSPASVYYDRHVAGAYHSQTRVPSPHLVKRCYEPPRLDLRSAGRRL